MNRGTRARVFLARSVIMTEKSTGKPSAKTYGQVHNLNRRCPYLANNSSPWPCATYFCGADGNHSSAGDGIRGRRIHLVFVP